MQVFQWGRRGAAIGLLVLAVGCRGPQSVFQFRPEAVAPRAPLGPEPTAPAPAVGAPAATTGLGSAPTPRPHPARVANKPPRLAAAPTPVRYLRAFRPETQRRPHRATQGQQPRRALGRDTRHLVLGGLLVAAGVGAGLLLGGWLGLGVGAAVVLLGYYFIVLGLGGKHAWLEIFQEFFNM